MLCKLKYRKTKIREMDVPSAKITILHFVGHCQFGEPSFEHKAGLFGEVGEDPGEAGRPWDRSWSAHGVE